MKAVLVGLADVDGHYEIAVGIDGTVLSLKPSQAASVADLIYGLLDGMGFTQEEDDVDEGEGVLLQ